MHSLLWKLLILTFYRNILTFSHNCDLNRPVLFSFLRIVRFKLTFAGYLNSEEEIYFFLRTALTILTLTDNCDVIAHDFYDFIFKTL